MCDACPLFPPHSKPEYRRHVSDPTTNSSNRRTNTRWTKHYKRCWAAPNQRRPKLFPIDAESQLTGRETAAGSRTVQRRHWRVVQRFYTGTALSTSDSLAPATRPECGCRHPRPVAASPSGTRPRGRQLSAGARWHLTLAASSAAFMRFSHIPATCSEVEELLREVSARSLCARARSSAAALDRSSLSTCRPSSPPAPPTDACDAFLFCVMVMVLAVAIQVLCECR